MRWITRPHAVMALFVVLTLAGCGSFGSLGDDDADASASSSGTSSSGTSSSGMNDVESEPGDADLFMDLMDATAPPLDTSPSDANDSDVPTFNAAESLDCGMVSCAMTAHGFSGGGGQSRGGGYVLTSATPPMSPASEPMWGEDAQADVYKLYTGYYYPSTP